MSALPRPAYLNRLRTTPAFRRQEQHGVVFGLAQLHALLASPHAHTLRAALAPPLLLQGLRLPPQAAAHAVTPAFLAQCSGLATTSPATACAALFALPPPPPPAAILQAHPRVLILDGVSDPGNLGTMLRTAAALHWGVLLTHGCCDPYNDKVLRAGTGAVFSPHWGWLEGGSCAAEASGPRALALAEAAAAGAAGAPLPSAPLLVLLVPAAGRELASAAARSPAAVRLVVGSEAHGISAAWLSATGALQARIGPPGGVLNASIAAALGMYALSPQAPMA